MTASADLFDWERQNAFARLSGDANPLHVDPAAARRLLFGRAVVHGVHGVLRALDRWAAGGSGPVRLLRLRASFAKPLFVGEEARWRPTEDAPGRSAGEWLWRDGVRHTIQWTWAEDPRPRRAAMPSAAPPPRTPAPTPPAGAAQGEIPTPLEGEGAARLFPAAFKRFPPGQLAALLATTRLVGMECPGEHSIFSEIDLTDNDRTDPRLSYTARAAHPALKMILLDVHGPGLSGQLKTFVRPSAVDQLPYAEAIRRVRPGEFADRRALVVGGSRGAGEAAVKLLCAGGAETTATYFQGEADARRVRADVESGKGRVRFRALDVVDPAALASLAAESPAPTHLYFFATPSIAPARRDVFSPALFHDYARVYVDAFAGLAQALAARGTGFALFPSSVFVTETPPGFAEYAAAKAAGEIAARALERARPGFRVTSPRWPRVATDQTAAVVGAPAPDPVPLLLEALRSEAVRPGPIGVPAGAPSAPPTDQRSTSIPPNEEPS